MLMEKGHRRVPVISYDGREVITRMTTSMATRKMFYTDSNRRDFLQRNLEGVTKLSLLEDSAKMKRSGNMIFLMTKANLEFQISELLLKTCIQHKSLKKTYQKRRGPLEGGVQDLRVKVSGS
ncbi:lysosomal alpha-mannosidase-like [Papaver somniferum]|uniref:lysosomal alpha-mannosidase-like n=1 Tax=Papaver somniferum TaxID=3469 RepID=UPI000E705BB5|nr:lysosomal alpha-mannosidase-like [Papaver somniferum]